MSSQPNRSKEVNSAAISEDASQLQDALQAQPTPAEQASEKESKAAGKKYHPSQVPFLDDSYTWQDRQQELELLKDLLEYRHTCVLAELQQIRSINASREYPHIAFQN